MEVERSATQMSENGSLSAFSLNLFGEFKRHETISWMEHNWTMSLYSVVAYVTFIFIGSEYMKNRKPFELKGIMTIWNFALAAFSITGTVSILPEFINILLRSNGFYDSVCQTFDDSVSKAAYFWGWMFCLSKLAELVDTVFIVLRKRKLIFLHWYHHVTVLLYCWYSYTSQIAPARWYVVVNFFIHSLMYTYYTLRAFGIRVPKPIAMTITILQLSQMVVGVVVNGYALRMKNQGFECDVPHHLIYLGLTMYASYFVLFAHFFYRAYFGRNKLKSA